MADDDRNFVDRARDVSKNWDGEEMTPDGMLQEFQLYGYAKRSTFLDQIDKDYQNADTSDLRKYHELVTLRRNMQQVHHTLRKAGR
ncbi:hypothetical protein ABIF65_003818 [Bradyrhizobium japonicum]|jgi:hypothetical protein|uniref:Uncharacterized protein n=1 Tax=Bradyrhizobium barranii subsp. barranii TaxID=2823807 RepID=A0A7Z0QHT1_9BRAD|nr:MULTISPECIES: hypothetical protein [Bradyrhizobium]WLC02297.1 hypothetical protein QIH92_24550 [Bradyrhizobium japonicum USDA 123]MBR1005083.1 hypothetical protein [Bradyrhizobium liaoningense]MBR1029847.1 hypothetical protein [Bradyrhizobium liaoningense]MCP1779534.1 hypothetical protein [Bradyrhizobium japonicum]MCP1859359.1 hypothetical protein [Bradyrhizobium japonicum]